MYVGLLRDCVSVCVFAEKEEEPTYMVQSKYRVSEIELDEHTGRA